MYHRKDLHNKKFEIEGKELEIRGTERNSRTDPKAEADGKA